MRGAFRLDGGQASGWLDVLARMRRWSKRGALHGALLATVVATVVGLPISASAAGPGSRAAELKAISLEDLLAIDIYTPGRREALLFDATTAIDVISGEEIERSGYTSIPEVLRLGAGLHVGRDESGSWGISARGFTSEQGNKMQVLIDGRNVYTPLYSGVFWDVQDTFIPDIDRIEVVRGPGATLWGANAVNGVINILSKEAAETQGVVAYGSSGNVRDRSAGVRIGGALNERTHFRVYLKGKSENAMVDSQGRQLDDYLDLAQAGFRFDSRGDGDSLFTFQGDLYAGESINYLVINDVKGGNLLARYSRQLGAGELRLQAYYDRVERLAEGWFGETRDTVDFEMEYLVKLGQRHELAAGFNFRSSSDKTAADRDVIFDPADQTINLRSAFVQDEITLAEDRLVLTIGSKFEKNTYSDLEIQPSVRLGWSPNDDSFFWGAVSRAVRTPTRLDRDVTAYFGAPVPVILGNPGLYSESLIAYETGFRFTAGERVTVDIAAYYNEYDELRVPEPDPMSPFAPFPLTYRNTMNADSYGIEAIVRTHLSDAWRVTVKYSYLDLDLSYDPGSNVTNESSLETNSPEHILTVQSLYDLNGSWQFDSTFRAVSELTNPQLSGYAELDLRIAWMINDNYRLELIGQNLLDDSHPEFGGSTLSENPYEVRRSVLVRLTARF